MIKLFIDCDPNVIMCLDIFNNTPIDELMSCNLRVYNQLVDKQLVVRQTYERVFVDSCNPDTENCEICHDNADIVFKTCCKKLHTYHKECLTTWLDISKSKRCPACTNEFECFKT